MQHGEIKQSPIFLEIKKNLFQTANERKYFQMNN